MISSYVLLGDVRAHYLIWQRDWLGQPIVLLHGLASNARIWELTAPHLLAAGLFPIALDQRGHGQTDKPDGDYGFDTFTRDLSAFLDACNIERPILVGHSWGASVVVDYASRFGVGLRAPKGIILVDGGLHQLNADPGANWETTRARLTPPHLIGTPVEDFRARVRHFTAQWNAPEQVVDIILANFTIRDDDTIAPNLSFDNHMKIVRAMWDFPTLEKLARIRVPALAVMATGFNPEWDATKAHAAERALHAKPDLKLVWMEQTAHDIPLHRPQDLAAHITHFAQNLP